jgi:prepilin-type N-terminal cleavage/methylation domain-containing protein
MQPVARQRGFTLIELLVVIAIIGILVAVSMPVLSHFRGDNLAGGVRQLLGDVARARQLAISQRTTVYMVFVPTNFWRSPSFSGLANPAFAGLPPLEQAKAAKLYDKQMVAYNFVALRAAGDQPGRGTVRYLGNWKSLPEGVIIPEFKFAPLAQVVINDPLVQSYDIRGFDVTYEVPFPSEVSPRSSADPQRPFVALPYIAFNHLGQLVSGAPRNEEYIPLARGTIGHALSPDKIPLADKPDIRENPAGNSTNAFTLIHIDRLTGRASVKRQEIR